MTRREVAAVLEPFAKFLNARSRGETDDTPIAETAVVGLGPAVPEWNLPSTYEITFGHLRAAKAMYEELSAEQPEASG